MKKTIASVAAAVLACIALNAANVVPKPAKMEALEGSYALPKVITVSGSEAAPAVKYLQMRGLEAQSTAKGASVLTAVKDASIPEEGYELEISRKGIALKASTQKGVMYGVETLSQLISQADGELPACRIIDEPRMEYRGLMLDVVRCYLPIDEVKKFVDAAAQLKLNTLHLHLTDDNGWRMEIKQYPKLTEVGAWRVDRPQIFPARLNPNKWERTTYGGYYTQDELKDLVAYAAERNINIIPEIEMPAHAIAAIASYPELGCPWYKEFVGVLPGIGGPAASIIMCAGNDNTLEFVKNVLDEVIEVFPSEYIHLGGDEANKAHWKECDLCKKRIADQGLEGFEELQGWFMDQINAYVRSKGRTAIGWDEVTYGKPKEDMVIMGWQGDGGVAVRYARETGRRFIMTPALKTYLIRYQGPQWFEPITYFGNITLQDAYEFDPVKGDWTEAMENQLMGIQGSMWTEFCRTPEEVQYMVFPRLLAIADAAWRPKGERDWSGFVAAADSKLQQLNDQGVTSSRAMYNIQHKATPNGDGTVTLQLENIRPDTEIWFASSQASGTYAEPLQISAPTTVLAKAVVPGVAEGKVLNVGLDFNKATGRKVTSEGCRNGLDYALTNGVRGSLRNSDFEWAGWNAKDADFTIDLGKEQPITSVKVGALGNADLTVALPKSLTLELAGEDGEFKPVETVEVSESLIYPRQALVLDFDFGNLDNTARYVRIKAVNPGRIPAGMAREGSNAWIYFDEVIVE